MNMVTHICPCVRHHTSSLYNILHLTIPVPVFLDLCVNMYNEVMKFIISLPFHGGRQTLRKSGINDT